MGDKQKGQTMCKQYKIVFADQQRQVKIEPFKSTLPLRLAQMAIQRWHKQTPSHIIPLIKPA
jgi:hypothetical protein